MLVLLLDLSGHDSEALAKVSGGHEHRQYTRDFQRVMIEGGAASAVYMVQSLYGA